MTDLQTLAHMISDIDFTMMTTAGRDGSLYSRPMSTQKIDKNNFDGELWFFTKRDSPKVHELEENQKVNLAYAQPDKQKYISVSGLANIVTDKEKMQDLWNPVYKAWFPEGLNDPQLCLIRVQAETAEFWDSPPSKVVQALGFAKAVITGKPYEQHGDNKQINLQH